MIVSYKTIGLNIRAARREAGLTQEQMAEKLKMSQLHFGRLERGERPASLEQLAQIAQALHVPLASLLNGCVAREDFSPIPDHNAQALGKAVAMMASGWAATSKKPDTVLLTPSQKAARLRARVTCADTSPYRFKKASSWP